MSGQTVFVRLPGGGCPGKTDEKPFTVLFARRGVSGQTVTVNGLPMPVGSAKKPTVCTLGAFLGKPLTVDRLPLGGVPL